MYKYRLRIAFYCFITIALIGGFNLSTVNLALAGIYDSDTEVTYKEYWIPHDDYYGECDDGNDTDRFFIEPTTCSPPLSFNIPDDFSSALRAEIYIDLWRNYDSPQAIYSINGNGTVQTNAGSDWSRTPYVASIPLAHLNQGSNQITFTGTYYHVHDVAIRIYYDGANPLKDSNGDIITAPDADLTQIDHDGGSLGAGGGGTLTVNNNQLTFQVSNITTDTQIVEVHGYYFGYDEDNDGQFTDWHNRNRNNWNPGGTDANPDGLGGTIDHIGSTAPAGAASDSVTWELAHIPDQSNVKFKLRVVSSDGNVREAAGGVKNNFTLSRTNPKLAFVNYNMEDAGLHISHSATPNQPHPIDRTIDLPTDIQNYNTAIVVHSFWNYPKFAFNGETQYDSYRDDHWQLAIKTISSSELAGGTNTITYYHEGGFGEFVEAPGAMIILTQQNASTNDTPTISGFSPQNGATNVDIDTEIVVDIADLGDGLDIGETVMQLGTVTSTVTVNPVASGTNFSQRLTFANLSSAFGYPIYDTDVTVTVSVEDTANNTAQESVTFHTEKAPVAGDLDSDDFNACTLDTALWTWSDPSPAGDATYMVDGEKLHITVPGGNSHDLWQNANHAPRIMQNVGDTDFILRAKFENPFNATLSAGQYMLQGMIVEDNPSDFLRINLQRDAVGTQVHTYAFTNGVPAALNTVDVADNGGALYLQIERTGDYWVVKYSTDGVIFLYAADFTYAMQAQKAGVWAGNASGTNAPGFTSIVDYFFDYAAQISPEDGTPLFLPVNVVGQGTVTKNIACGVPPVQLTATPTTGWSFEKYSGDYNGKSAVADVVFSAGDVVTATFTQNQYVITDTINDGMGGNAGGMITMSMPGTLPGYIHNEVATVSLSINPGWQFTGWTGDLSTTNMTETLVMTEDKVIVANMEQIPYNVTVNKVGNGSATSSAAPYYYGNAVSLTASAQPGWTFAGWSGDLVSASSNESITIDGDIEVTATFAQDQYTLTVVDNGPGTTAVSPAQSTYVYSDAITLTASANPGHSFAGWSGAGLTGTDPSTSITLTKSEVVTAVYTQDYYTITTNPSTGGAITVDAPADSAGYAYGESPAITATADPGYAFQGWTSDISGSSNPNSLNVQGDTNVGAMFALEYYQMTVGVEDNSGNSNVGGTATISAAADAAGYVYAESIILTATPAPGYVFAGWSGDFDGSDASSSTSATGNMTFIAKFAEDVAYTLTVNTTGSGAVNQLPVSGPHYFGDVVELTAVAEPGWNFIGWGSDATGNEASLQVTIDGNKTIEARFAQGVFTVGQSVVGNGTIASTPEKAGYELDEEITYTATPALGWIFAGWTGAVTGPELSQTLTVQANGIVTATFTQELYTISTAVVGNGSANIAPLAGSYVHGDVVTLSAIADDGFAFAGWETGSGLFNGDNPASLTITGSEIVTATFIPEQDSVSITPVVNGNGRVVMSPEKNVYQQGELVTFTAIPDSCVTFGGWTAPLGTEQSALDISVELPASNDLQISALFESTGCGTYLPIVSR